jgi:hypothetical protein
VKRSHVVADDAERRVELGGEVLRAGLAAADRGKDLDAQRVRDSIQPASVHRVLNPREAEGSCASAT